MQIQLKNGSGIKYESGVYHDRWMLVLYPFGITLEQQDLTMIGIQNMSMDSLACSFKIECDRFNEIWADSFKFLHVKHGKVAELFKSSNLLSALKQNDITFNVSIDIIKPTRVAMEIGTNGNEPYIGKDSRNLKDINNMIQSMQQRIASSVDFIKENLNTNSTSSAAPTPNPIKSENIKDDKHDNKFKVENQKLKKALYDIRKYSKGEYGAPRI